MSDLILGLLIITAMFTWLIGLGENHEDWIKKCEEDNDYWR